MNLSEQIEKEVADLQESFKKDTDKIIEDVKKITEGETEEEVEEEEESEDEGEENE